MNPGIKLTGSPLQTLVNLVSIDTSVDPEVDTIHATTIECVTLDKTRMVDTSVNPEMNLSVSPV